MQAIDERRGLKVLCLVCLAGLIPCFAAFVVNVELGLRVFFPGAVWLETILPAGLFQRLAFFSIDLSAVSTFVPVLTLAFPLIQGWRVLRRPPDDRAFLRELAADPYPPHFAFFFVMLGLVGTLHGMWIGLRSSGVADVGTLAPSTETIQGTLDRLMEGTATAILSSLVGIIFAFFVAKPIPWLFRRLIRQEQEESRTTLTETLEHLTRDLHGLSEASRGFAAFLDPAGTQAVFQRLENLERSIQSLEAKFDRVGDTLQAMEKAQAETRPQLQRLETIDASLREAATRAGTANDLLRQLADAQARGTGALEAFVAAADRQQKVMAEHLSALAATVQAQAEESRAERGAVKRALSEFVK